MENKRVPPSAEALEQLLAARGQDTASTVLRLAWQAGLTRQEIAALTWVQVELSPPTLRLPTRTVPLLAALSAYLERLRPEQGERAVVLSDRRNPMRPQALSNLVRPVLDAAGQAGVTLRDLRNDFIKRQLADHDWQYVSRIAGMAAPALQRRVSETLSTRIDAGRKPAMPDTARLEQLLAAEGVSAAGLAIRLVWQAGLRVSEVSALTWAQVDTNHIRLPDRTVSLSPEITQALQALETQAAVKAGPLLATRTGRRYPPDRLSRLARRVLVRAGLDHISLSDLRRDFCRRGGGRQILELARRRGSVSRREAAEQMGVAASAAYAQLAALTEQGALVRLGARYYLPETVVAPEAQYEAVRAYLEETGIAYRKELARVLGLSSDRCAPVLRRLLAEGKLMRVRQQYMLRRPDGGALQP